MRDLVSGRAGRSLCGRSLRVPYRGVGIHDADIGMEYLRVVRVQGHQVQLREVDMAEGGIILVGGTRVVLQDGIAVVSPRTRSTPGSAATPTSKNLRYSIATRCPTRLMVAGALGPPVTDISDPLRQKTRRSSFMMPSHCATKSSAISTCSQLHTISADHSR